MFKNSSIKFPSIFSHVKPSPRESQITTRNSWHVSLTCDAGIFHLQVVFQLHVTRAAIIKGRLDDIKGAGAPRGTPLIQHIQHVDVTADKTEVRSDAGADAHAPIEGAMEEEDLVECACHFEASEMTELLCLAPRRERH